MHNASACNGLLNTLCHVDAMFNAPTAAVWRKPIVKVSLASLLKDGGGESRDG